MLRPPLLQALTEVERREDPPVAVDVRLAVAREQDPADVEEARPVGREQLLPRGPLACPQLDTIDLHRNLLHASDEDRIPVAVEAEDDVGRIGAGNRARVTSIDWDDPRRDLLG